MDVIFVGVRCGMSEENEGKIEIFICGLAANFSVCTLSQTISLERIRDSIWDSQSLSRS